eukprot:TRINITY_DN13983_c0_g1_i1.p1 TRINITY_DN13983_c0_g1~~TRINITY_DN13983_c0_g1_i1.p1  ORF type:complete len:293 (-),score=94.48 TRINITY_DN13983_c0_g1_i1:6-884(-)
MGDRSIRVEILKLNKEQRKMTFLIENINLALANSLRRIMLSEIPTVAIHLVDVIQNGTPLFDEFITHRLGLIPIKSRNLHHECGSQEGDVCSIAKCSCQFELRLEKTPTNEMEGVKSDRLVPLHPGMELVSTDILIASLGNTQYTHEGVLMNCTATMGIAKKHAKYSAVSKAVFQPEPVIEINPEVMQEMVDDDKIKIVESCPRKVFQLQDRSIVVARPWKCFFCDECVRKANEIGRDRLVTISRKTNVFKFRIEAIGSVDVENIFQEAIDILIGKLNDLRIFEDDNHLHHH